MRKQSEAGHTFPRIRPRYQFHSIRFVYAARFRSGLAAGAAQAGLTLHPEKTRIVDERQQGFDFLGYHFGQSQREPRKKSLTKLKDTIRGKTRRLNGTPMGCIISTVNQTLRGWFGYFKHSRRETFGPLDAWVRMRLRSILRRRHGGHGRGRGHDHYRWPNAYFAKLGLFSLLQAHRLVCQPARR